MPSATAVTAIALIVTSPSFLIMRMLLDTIAGSAC
jgi:hypothetical protein